MELYLVYNFRYSLIITLLSEILRVLSTLEYIDLRTMKLTVRKLPMLLCYGFLTIMIYFYNFVLPQDLWFY